MRIIRRRVKGGCLTTIIPLPIKECSRMECPMERELPPPKMVQSFKLNGSTALMSACFDSLYILPIHSLSFLCTYEMIMINLILYYFP